MEQTGRLTNSDLERLMSGLKAFSELLDYSAAAVKAAVAGLDEVRSVRDSLHRGQRPLSWEAFCLEVGQKDAQFGRLLQQASAVKFEWGKAQLFAADPITNTSLIMFKDRIVSFLRDVYGGKFRVKILEAD